MRRMLNAPQVRRRPNLPLKRWINRAEFETLLASGVFAPEERLELLAGELVRREPVGPQHAVAVALVSETLTRLALENMHVRVQLPLALGEYDEPFPDIAVVAGSPRDYLTNHPTTALLVVEVAEASLHTDRDIKASLYAHAGIPEYWIVNLKARVVEVYREPVPDNKAIYGASYRHRQVLRAGAVVDLVCCSGVVVAVEALLP